MAHVNVQRTGVATLMQLAHRLCTLIVRFTPTITRVYHDRPALLAALAAANAACAVLGQELAEVRRYGD